MSVAATRRSRMESWCRRLLALYPKDHRREHAEEMVGVLLAADGDTQVRAPQAGAWALRFGQHTAGYVSPYMSVSRGNSPVTDSSVKAVMTHAESGYP